MFRYLNFLFLFFFSLNISAANQLTNVPSVLKEWHGWVLDKHPELNCSFNSHATARQCQWHSVLKLSINNHDVHFSQRLFIEKAGWYFLPGSHQNWPEKLIVNSQLMQVMRYQNTPSLFLEPGEFNIEGVIKSHSPISSLKLPKTSTFINLTIDGKVIANPNIVGHQLLLTHKKKTVTNKQNSVNLQVYRLLKDGYPMLLETRIDLRVSGNQRVENIGRAIPNHFEITQIQSNLPLHINKQGDIQVQLKAGQHSIILKARLHNDMIDKNQKFNMQANENWPQQELWSVLPDRSYRVIDLKGTAIDSSQTNIPREWKKYSSYLITEKKGISIEETSRGDVNPQKHELSLKRTLWLSFSGDKFTTQEKVVGKIGYLDRLSADNHYSAGRVSINNQPVLLTSVENDQGVEVLPGQFEMISVGAINHKKFEINPWNTTLNDSTLKVNLPPGYSIFAVKGANSVSNDYISGWNLWEIFIVILFVVLLFKQFGLPAGIVGFLYSMVIHNVYDAPSIILLLFVVGFYGVINVLPQHKFKGGLIKVYKITLLLLFLSFIPFAIQQARLAIFPQLEKDGGVITVPHQLSTPYTADNSDSLLSQIQSAPRELKKSAVKLQQLNELADVGSTNTRLQKYTQKYQENEIIQTGPGMPAWQWNEVNIQMSGPIAIGQTIELVILPPWLNRIINLLRIVLFVLLAVLLIRGQHEGGSSGDNKSDKSSLKLRDKTLSNGSNLIDENSIPRNNITIVIFCFLFASLFFVPVAQADYPDEKLLEEYYQRLNTPELCHPDCVAINQLDITADEEVITLDMRVFSLTKAALVLPIDIKNISNATILVDNRVTNKLSREGQNPILLLDKGQHSVVVKLKISGKTQLNLSFATIPHVTYFDSEHWQVFGLKNRSMTNATLQFRKNSTKDVRENSQRLTPDPISPYIKVKRVFDLDIDWRVTTTVTRISPVTGAFSIDLPLLSGETVINDKISIVDGVAKLHFSQNRRQVSWVSDMNQSDNILLQATSRSDMFEEWQIQPSLRWHLSYEGIRPIKSNRSELIWKPRVNDSLNIKMKKPVPVLGKSVAIDSVSFDYRPADKLSQSKLMLTFRATKSSDYPIQLPANAVVENVIVNGRNISYVLEGSDLLLPISPGIQQVEIKWTQSENLNMVTNTPNLNIGEASNVKISTFIPADRWLLVIKGPLIGPAILLWGGLLVILIAGCFLGKQSWSPLKSWQWMLMGTGIATSFWPITVLVTLWFFIMSKRQVMINVHSSVRRFQCVQILITIMTVVMLFSLIVSVAKSLTFGAPDMQIVGNGSYHNNLYWYQDAIESELPSTAVVSMPMWGYQILMLIWSIWLSLSLIQWLKWGWVQFSQEGIWKSAPPKSVKNSKKAKADKNDLQRDS